MSEIKNCTWNNTWTDSGDRGAAQHDHDRAYHPDHIHVWVFRFYAWENDSVQRCSTCAVRKQDDHSGECK